LPITAFLIADAAREHRGYWKDFAAAGGMIGDHTVSHPYLTKLTQAKATAQWGQARTALGRWLGQAPVVGRPPYGAFGRTVEVAAARAGLTALAGWSATMSGDRIETWNGKPLSPGEIVILHWVPGLGRQLTVLLAAIRALHLNPAHAVRNRQPHRIPAGILVARARRVRWWYQRDRAWWRRRQFSQVPALPSVQVRTRRRLRTG
jgi:peptidoglycan/xylan/chitin deacetylase (PgdA/CDA1 family)